MRIVIADDEPKRYESIVKQATEDGISKNDFEFAQSIHELRNAIEKDETIALLVIDLLLPAFTSDHDVSSHHTIDLLRELANTGEMLKPERIIGITSDPDVHKEHYMEFQQFAWAILKYDATSTDWATSLSASIRWISNISKDEEKSTRNVDIVVICALQSPELDAVLSLDFDWSPPEPIDDITFCYEGTIRTEHGEYSIVAACQQVMGMIASSLLAFKLVNHFQPKVITMLGICAGVEGKTSIGDAVFAQSVWDYQAGKHVEKQTGELFELSPLPLIASSEAGSVFQLMSSDTKKLEDIASRFADPPNKSPKILIGPVASGSAVVSNSGLVKDIVRQNRNLLAIEMEIYGVYCAVQFKNSPRPRVFAIKSVCDFANPDKNDDYQEFAAFMSAQTFAAAMHSYSDQIIGSSSE